MTAPPRGAHLLEWFCHDKDNQAWTFLNVTELPRPVN